MENYPIGSEVNLLGVWQSFYADCDDEGCERKHYTVRVDPETEQRTEVPRYHYEEGPREGRPATVVGHEPRVGESAADKHLIILKDDEYQSQLACDIEDLELVSKPE